MYNNHPNADRRVGRKQTPRKRVWRTTDGETHPITVRFVSTQTCN